MVKPRIYYEPGKGTKVFYDITLGRNNQDNQTNNRLASLNNEVAHLEHQNQLMTEYFVNENRAVESQLSNLEAEVESLKDELWLSKLSKWERDAVLSRRRKERTRTSALTDKANEEHTQRQIEKIRAGAEYTRELTAAWEQIAKNKTSLSSKIPIGVFAALFSIWLFFLIRFWF
jgi:hypothetical protein